MFSVYVLAFVLLMGSMAIVKCGDGVCIERPEPQTYRAVR